MADTIELRRLRFTFYTGERGQKLVRVENTGDVLKVGEFVDLVGQLLREAVKRG